MGGEENARLVKEKVLERTAVPNALHDCFENNRAELR